MMNADRRRNSSLYFLCWITSLACFVWLPASAMAEQSVLDINDFDLSTIESNAVELSIVTNEKCPAIRMESTPDKEWLGIEIRLEEHSRDLSAFEFLAIDARNMSDQEIVFAMRVDCVDGKKQTDAKTKQRTLAPGELQTIRLLLDRKLPKHREGRFQYGDQAATVRGDGENYQIGFVDVCDPPYVEMIETARKIGRMMYSLRLQP